MNQKQMKYFLLSFFTIALYSKGFSQDLEAILDKESAGVSEVVLGTFNGTRLLNGHSVETRKEGVLEFMISHRFGRLNSGFDNLYGLDESNIRFGFEYGLTNDVTVALGRSSLGKTFDTYIKYRLLKQQTGEKAFPFSVTLFGSAVTPTIKDYAPDNKPSFSNRLVYTGQVLVAKKINPNLSFQFSPTFIHFNTIPQPNDANDMVALGFGTRVKISKRVSVNGEYYYNLNPFESIDTKNSIALGIDIETGGHIFQLVFTNAVSMLEKGFITETTGGFFKGDIHFGFNISRAFQVKKHR